MLSLKESELTQSNSSSKALGEKFQEGGCQERADLRSRRRRASGARRSKIAGLRRRRRAAGSLAEDEQEQNKIEKKENNLHFWSKKKQRSTSEEEETGGTKNKKQGSCMELKKSSQRAVGNPPLSTSHAFTIYPSIYTASHLAH
ncbi:unnamed protein product [Pleuronectes platessa]|uniref:Uncharacterized protein n=1 Tax=Pleuronectes platessa TaxID=8262 RepID=A0A9N7Y5E0_PLEPL|nr:unnamed protein product [Pleuronectes platessa]